MHELIDKNDKENDKMIKLGNIKLFLLFTLQKVDNLLGIFNLS